MRNMVVLIDTNVIINDITGRDDTFGESSTQIMKLCGLRRLNGYIAFHSLSTIWYILRKRPESDRRFLLGNVCNILTITSATQRQVRDAIANKDFHDFEDCLQDQCAKNAGAEYIVTCNIKDFRNAETRAVTPAEMLDIFRHSGGQL